MEEGLGEDACTLWMRPAGVDTLDYLDQEEAGTILLHHPVREAAAVGEAHNTLAAAGHTDPDAAAGAQDTSPSPGDACRISPASVGQTADACHTSQAGEAADISPPHICPAHLREEAGSARDQAVVGNARDQVAEADSARGEEGSARLLFLPPMPAAAGAEVEAAAVEAGHKSQVADAWGIPAGAGRKGWAREGTGPRREAGRRMVRGMCEAAAAGMQAVAVQSVEWRWVAAWELDDSLTDAQKGSAVADRAEKPRWAHA